MFDHIFSSFAPTNMCSKPIRYMSPNYSINENNDFPKNPFFTTFGPNDQTDFVDYK
jgi:hypothetical protein